MIPTYIDLYIHICAHLHTSFYTRIDACIDACVGRELRVRLVYGRSSTSVSTHYEELPSFTKRERFEKKERRTPVSKRDLHAMKREKKERDVDLNEIWERRRREKRGDGRDREEDRRDEAACDDTFNPQSVRSLSMFISLRILSTVKSSSLRESKQVLCNGAYPKQYKS